MNTAREKLLAFISQHNWYHQRFTGAPFFLDFIAEAELRFEERKKDFAVHSWRVCFFEDGKADWYILKEDLAKTAKSIMAQITDIKDKSGIKDFVKNLRSKWREDENRFYKYCKELDSYNFISADSSSLLRALLNLKSLYLNAVSCSSLIDGFVLETDERFGELLKAHLERKGLHDRFSDYFTVLSSGNSLSFLSEMELNLMNLALEVRKNRELGNLFHDYESADLLNLLREKYPALYHDLLGHRYNYFWVKNNYLSAHDLSVEHFLEELKKFVPDQSLSNKKQKLLDKLDSLELRKSKILEEIDSDKELVSLVYLSSGMSVWQDERKKMTFFATHYFTLILEQIARESGHTLQELKYLSSGEVEYLLSHAKAISFDPQSRIKKCAFVWHKNGVDVFTDDGFIENLRGALIAHDFVYDKDLKGLIASPGKAVGRVRIIDVIEKIDSFEEDEILVAVMTRPDFLTAIKKAGAIVTDEGGVTSHAAVISREFNIPCLVATKVATNVLKDGDWVEVDAFNGTIKKLPK